MVGKGDAKLIEILLVPQVKDTDWVEIRKKEALDKKEGGCTFKPDSFTQDYVPDKQIVSSGDKCKDLYGVV